jgi:ribonuclease HI
VVDKWSKPLSDHVKVNADASFFDDIKSGAVSAVIRDSKGMFISGSYSYLKHVESASTAEAITMRDGLKLAKNLGCNAVQVESDSMEDINACTGEEMWWSSCAAIYVECVDSISVIGKVTFKHCSRETNKVAHYLARFSYFS